MRQKRAWFTDTIDDGNGVSTTIRMMALAMRQNRSLVTVITSRSKSLDVGIPVVNFPPIAEFSLPEYESQKLTVPPFAKILSFMRRERFSSVIISTPGPVGFAGLVAAKLLGLPVHGIDHTDFPKFVRDLKYDPAGEAVCGALMCWFYRRMDTIWVNSACYRAAWIERGIPVERLRLLPRGVDRELFCSARRQHDFWQKKGAGAGDVVLMYAGRLSREKNLGVLAEAWERLRRPGLMLAFVGDGPCIDEVRVMVPDAIFTGWLSGEELATAFASADVFLFPSNADTFGNVVLEALASGLPCVVSDSGGPCELIENGITGFITTANNAVEFADAARRIASDFPLRERMKTNAESFASDWSWKEAARIFWHETAANLHPTNVKWSGR